MEACMYSYQHPEERVSERAHSGSGTVFAVHEGEITVCCEESGYIATGDDKGFVRVWSFNHPFCSWVVNPDEASDESNRVIFELQLICSQTESTDASICIAIRSRFALRVVRVHVETRRDRNNSTRINGEMILHWPESEVGMMEKMTGDRFLMWLNKKQLLMCHPIKDPIIVDVEKKSTHPVADSLGGGQCTLQDVRGDGRNLTHVAIGYQCGAVGLLELLTLRIHPVIKNFHLYRNCIPQTPVQSLETQYPHSIVSGRGMWSTCTYEPSTCVVFFENRRPRMLVSCTPASSWSITPIHEDYSHIPYNENVASMKQLPHGVLDSSSHTLHTFTCRGSYCVCVCVHSDQVHVVVYSIVRVQSSQNHETRACANSTSFFQLVPIFQRISLESQVSAIRAHPNRDLIVLCMCDHGLRFLERKKEWVLHEETPVHCEQISTCVFQAEAPHTLIAGGACGAIHLLGSPSWFDQLHRTVQTLRFEHPQREELSHMRSDGSSLCVPQLFVDKNEWTVFHQAVIKNHLLWTKQTQRRLNKKRKR